MKKRLPKLKKTVTSFLVEEDAKLMSKSASRIALSTAMMSSMILINLEEGNAIHDHSDHKNHSNDVDLPAKDSSGHTSYDPRLLNLGNSDDEVDVIYDEELEITVMHDSISLGRYYADGYIFSVPTDASTTGAVSPSSYPYFGTTSSAVEFETISSSNIDGQEFTITTQYNPDNPAVGSYNLDVNFSTKSSDPGDIAVTIGDTTQTLSYPSYGSSNTVTVENQETKTVSPRTEAKSISAVHSNHFDHSNDGGW